MEDDEILRCIIFESLEDDGYTVMGTHSPDIGLGFGQAQAFGFTLADVRMAGSTDGV